MGCSSASITINREDDEEGESRKFACILCT